MYVNLDCIRAMINVMSISYRVSGLCKNNVNDVLGLIKRYSSYDDRHKNYNVNKQEIIDFFVDSCTLLLTLFFVYKIRYIHNNV